VAQALDALAVSVVTVTISSSPPKDFIGQKMRYHKVLGIKGVVREYNPRKTISTRMRQASAHPRWKSIHRRNCWKSYMMKNYTKKNQKKGRMIHPPAPLNAEEIEEVIDILTERLAALSQNDIDAYLESFESDDDESCSSDLNDFDDFGSEEEDEVGAVDDDASH
jgi:hypothetical protein